MLKHPTTLTLKGAISMCTYCDTNNYRKIYENHIGPIPREDNGRTYEIHHLDGNHSNNDPANLKAVTIQEHYDIHYNQGDWGACLLISRAIAVSSDEKSKLASDLANKRVIDKTHHWLGENNPAHRKVIKGTHPFQTRKDGSSLALDRAKAGTNPLQDADAARARALKRVEDGTHNFQDADAARARALKRAENGTNPFSERWTCEHCNKSGKGKGNYSRHHGNNCKILL